jgi:hypothetical protein
MTEDQRQEFIDRLKICVRGDHGDNEDNHIRADEVLCDILDLLGYEDLVSLWHKVGKWYA